MIWNIIVAFTNFTIYYPLRTSLLNEDYWTFISIFYVGLFSFLSHLVENHKHGMAGIGFSQSVSYYLNRLDVSGCCIVALRFAYLYYTKYGFSIDIILGNKLKFVIFALPLIFVNISEYDKYNPGLKYMYICFHCLWHILVFICMDGFLKNFIYA